MSATILKTATAKATIEYNKCFFSIELTIENETGLLLSEVNTNQTNAIDMAKHGVETYKATERQIKDSVPTFDADKNLDELLQKANRIKSPKK